MKIAIVYEGESLLEGELYVLAKRLLRKGYFVEVVTHEDISTRFDKEKILKHVDFPINSVPLVFAEENDLSSYNVVIRATVVVINNLLVTAKCIKDVLDIVCPAVENRSKKPTKWNEWLKYFEKNCPEYRVVVSRNENGLRRFSQLRARSMRDMSLIYREFCEEHSIPDEWSEISAKVTNANEDVSLFEQCQAEVDWDECVDFLN